MRACVTVIVEIINGFISHSHQPSAAATNTQYSVFVGCRGFKNTYQRNRILSSTRTYMVFFQKTIHTCMAYICVHEREAIIMDEQFYKA